MPAALDDARQNLQNPPQIYTEIALEQLPGLIEFFPIRRSQGFCDGARSSAPEGIRTDKCRRHRRAGELSDWLKNDLLPRSHGDFRLGADTYRKKL